MPAFLRHKFIAIVAILVAFGYLFGPLFSSKATTGFNIRGFARLPVLDGGRIKPLDTVARTSLLIISGRQTLRIKGEPTKSAAEWLLDVLYRPEKANEYEIFRIDEPDVLGLIGIQQTTQTRYPFSALAPHLEEIEKQATAAERTPTDQRTLFQHGIFNLQNKIFLYQQLQNTLQAADSPNLLGNLTSARDALQKLPQGAGAASMDADAQNKLMSLMQQCQLMSQFAAFRSIPLSGQNAWVNLGQLLLRDFRGGGMRPELMDLLTMGEAYRAPDAEKFNTALAGFSRYVAQVVPQDRGQAEAEELFNRLAPFYKSMALYIIVLLLIGAFWLSKKPALSQAAFALLLVAFAVHTGGLISRVVLQGRPPVTNLYSSAVFVGWGAVLFGVILEWMYKRGIGLVLSAVIGFATLIIAHHLSLQGDTMEMMRAVLDSNFWLATHVVTITIGYSSTFLCGAVAIAYLLRRAFDRNWNRESADVLSQMVYGLLCVSALLTFVGTVLGGIWADQSWGRFWGWDPKENGALLIVLWILLILHARAGKLISDTGVMALSIFGNVVTALAWFGVNMLNIGLHSYGYMEKGFVWLVAFTVSQIAIMALGLLPERAPKKAGGLTIVG